MTREPLTGTYVGERDTESGVLKLVLTPTASPPVDGVLTVRQGGVTLTFQSPVAVLENFQGNHFLRGPVAIATIDPAPSGEGEARRNGAMVNPSNYLLQAMDGRFSTYSEADAYVVGTALAPGDSLLCSVSRHPDEDLAFLLSEGGGGNPLGISEYQIFTVVDELPDVETFIPPVCGTEKPLWTVDDVNLDLLPGLETTFTDVTIGEGPNGGIKLDDTRHAGCHKWLVFQGGDNHALSGVQQSDVMSWYPSDMAGYTNRLAVYCMTDLSRSDEMALRLVQFGIQQRAVAKMEGWSEAFGAGYGAARQLPIMFAGWLLEDGAFLTEAQVNNANEKYPPSFQYYYSASAYDGYAMGYPPATWACGPEFPMFGDHNDPAFFGANNSTRDPTGKYVACCGIGSNVGYAESGVRYQAVDAENTYYAVGGAYLVLSAQGHVGARLWSALAGLDEAWGGDKAWIDFCDWFHFDRQLAFSPNDANLGNDANPYYWDIRQSGGVGNGFMLEMWDNYGPFYT